MSTVTTEDCFVPSRERRIGRNHIVLVCQLPAEQRHAAQDWYMFTQYETDRANCVGWWAILDAVYDGIQRDVKPALRSYHDGFELEARKHRACLSELWAAASVNKHA